MTNDNKKTMAEFFHKQVVLVQEKVNSLQSINYPQAICRELNSTESVHFTLSFSDSGLNKPTGMQLDLLGNPDTGKIWIEIIYLDLMFNSLTTKELQELTSVLVDVELQMMNSYSQLCNL
ncbi:TPA: hypothetical protein U1045_001871 [Streptococcus suis]|nr:hypothetical protein [Streptococcus suis]